jgi:hypothetical protein
MMPVSSKEASMSTGLECEFTEVEPGKWYYLLEDGFAPKNAWDWREYSNAFGPFQTLEEAEDHLRRNHANPGGAFIDEYKAGKQIDEVVQRVIAEARTT